MTPPSTCRGKDEAGSVVIALSVMLVLALLSLALLARTLSSLGTARRTQSADAALAAADGGLADAVFHIDQGAAGPTMTGTGTLGEASFSYVADRVDLDEWLVAARGDAHGVPRGVASRVVRDPLYPYAVFTNETLALAGGVAGDIGSNREVVVSGGIASGEQHFLTSCTGCPTPVLLPEPRALPLPVAPALTQPCPPDGLFTGTVVGLGGRPFLCDATDVTFFETVDVLDGPLAVHVGVGRTLDLRAATVNTAVGSTAADVRLSMAGTGSVLLDFTVLRGVIDAPHAQANVTGFGADVSGSMVLSELRVGSGVPLSVAYDESVRSIAAGPWRMVDYREIPSAQVPAG